MFGWFWFLVLRQDLSTSPWLSWNFVDQAGLELRSSLRHAPPPPSVGTFLTDRVLLYLAAELDQYVFQDTQLEGLSKDLFSKSGEVDLGSVFSPS